MKQLFLSASLSLVVSCCFSQNGKVIDSSIAQNDRIATSDDSGIVFTKTEIEASFPGGNSGWVSYLQKELNPNAPVDHGIRRKGKYMVIIRFIVGKDGTIRSAEAETKYGYGMEEEALRVIMKGPKWIPAYQNGRAVNAYRRQPITFLVN